MAEEHSTPDVLVVGSGRRYSIGSYYARGFREAGCATSYVGKDGSSVEPDEVEEVGPPTTVERWKARLRRSAAAVTQRPDNRFEEGVSRARHLLNRLRESGRREAVAERIREAVDRHDPDLLLGIGTLEAPGLWVQYAQEKGASVFFYHTEALRSHPSQHPPELLEIIPHFDAVFTSTQSDVDEYRKEGASRVEFIPFGFDPKVHRPPELSKAEAEWYGADVTFVGKWWFERAELLEELCEEFDVRIWGGSWDSLPPGSPATDAVTWRIVRGPAMAKVYRASKIAINNLTRRPNRHGHLMRTFEIPACGGFQLSERSEETLRWFEEGKDIACFDNIEECKETIRRYLDDDAAREAIRRNGYERCRMESHSYEDRARSVLETYAQTASEF